MTDRIRFRMVHTDIGTITEVWVDSRGWVPASSKDLSVWGNQTEQEELDIPEKEGK